MFGVQWDLVLKYLNVKGGLTVADITENSTKWGNYYDNRTEENTSFIITSEGAKALELYGETWNAIEKDTVKSSKAMILTTGSSSDLALLNIYDLAGNIAEYTLEFATDIDELNGVCVFRGSIFSDAGSVLPLSMRYANFPEVDGVWDGIGFRVSLY